MRARQISFFIFCVVLYGGFSYSGYRIFLVALIVIVLLALTSLAELHWVRSRLTLSQRLEPDPVYTDDAAQLVIEIKSRTRLPIAVLEIIAEQRRAENLESVGAAKPVVSIEANAAATSSMAANAGAVVGTAANAAAAAVNAAASVANAVAAAVNAAAAPKAKQTAEIILRYHRVTSLIGRGKFRETIRLRTDEARIYDVSACQVGIHDPFGLFSLPLRCEMSASQAFLRLHVLPQPDQKLLSLAWLQNNRDGFNPSQRMSEEVNAIADLHQMNPGDSPKRIHWIISAKQNQWMIKRFEKDEQAHIMLLPDLAAGQVTEKLLPLRRDAILSLAAAAVQQMLQSELSVLLVTSDASLHSTFASRNDQLLDMLIQLASAPDQSEDPLRHQALEGLARLPDDAMVVMITATPDDALSALAGDLIKAGHRVIVILYENPLLAMPAPERQLNRLAASGVRLIRIREADPERLRHPERLHALHRTADGWRQVRRGAVS